jgi:hypothetical protein
MLYGRDHVTGEGLSAENIRFQLATFLIAGHEVSYLLGRFIFLANMTDDIRPTIIPIPLPAQDASISPSGPRGSRQALRRSTRPVRTITKARVPRRCAERGSSTQVYRSSLWCHAKEWRRDHRWKVQDRKGAKRDDRLGCSTYGSKGLGR